MHKLTESKIESFAIELLCSLGYRYCAPMELPRRSTAELLLEEPLLASLQRLNPSLPPELLSEVPKALKRLRTTDLLSNNKALHRLLTEGLKIDTQRDGSTRGEIIRLVDFEVWESNDFIVADQVTITEGGHQKRPDLLLFVNGIPLILIELKNAADANATLRTAYEQIKTYKSQIPSLFVYNAFCIISDGLEARTGSISADFSRYMAWRSSDGQVEDSRATPQLETLIRGMLRPSVLLDLLRSFIIFEQSRREDAQGITTIQTVKKLAAYHQYYAVNKAIERTLRASEESGDKKGGVIWHTQGSGKSLSMLFYAGKIILALRNPTLVILTDRNDLDDQLFETFAAASMLLRQEPVQARNREDLKQRLKVASGGVIFTTIQKFQPEEGSIYEALSKRHNIVVIADEAHRTQYGFKPKIVDERDAQGRVVGQRVAYGFAKYLRDALPHATYLGFTGTPIEGTDVNTPAVFGDYVDIYDIAQAVEDGATVRIFYESRLAKISLSEEGKELIKELDEELLDQELDQTQQAKAKWTKVEALIGSRERIREVARDIVTHFEARQEVFRGKGMIVSMSRRIAALLYKEIIALRPEWHSEDLSKGVVKVVMTASSSDGPELSAHHTTKEERRTLSNRMKDIEDPLKLVIVRDMWLTGFDVPAMHTLYIDKPMKGHSLMQAIARVNRVYKDKPGGLVVDYMGIGSDLKKALSFYSESGGRGDPTLAQEQAVALMRDQLESIAQMYDGFDYREFFSLDTRGKLALILAAEDHILSLEDGKKCYIEAVTILSRAFAIAIPHEEAMEAKEEVAFFQAVKARLMKFESNSRLSSEELEMTIRQVVDRALVSEPVVDIFDASGLKKPEISILSEEFLLEVQNMQHKNVAFELLKKLLHDEIRARAKVNLTYSKTLMEMLESSIRKYHNKLITTSEVIQELMSLSKDITNLDVGKEAKELGLTEFEYAFYTAVADNESAKELMGKETLRGLAVLIAESVRKDAVLDWTLKESARAKLRTSVKRILRAHGYPPNMQELATQTVLEQAEEIAARMAEEL